LEPRATSIQQKGGPPAQHGELMRPSASPSGLVSPSRELFARLFRRVPYRFELGLSRGDGRWFQPGNPDSPILHERRRWLEQEDIPVAFWREEAGPALAETLSRFRDASNLTGESPDGAARLRRFSATWEPDFVLLRRDGAGDFRMVGGCVCFPSAWDPAEKLGQTVEVIHGPVPTLNPELGARIRTFLGSLPPGTVFERENWGLAAVPERNLHPARALPRLATDTPLDRVWLRVEHQAFHALPAADGLLFIIHLTVHRLTDVLADPVTCGRFADALATMPDAMAGYKGLQPARENLLAAVRRLPGGSGAGQIPGAPHEDSGHHAPAPAAPDESPC